MLIVSVEQIVHFLPHLGACTSSAGFSIADREQCHLKERSNWTTDPTQYEPQHEPTANQEDDEHTQESWVFMPLPYTGDQAEVVIEKTKLIKK